MKQKFTLAASTFVLAALFSFGWSEQSGVSLSIEKAEARVGRPLTPMSVAGVARRQTRRAVYGAGVVGAGAAAVGTAAAVAATSPNWAAGPTYSGTVRGARAAYYGGAPAAAGISSTPHYAVTAYYAGGPWYGYSGWDDYASRNGLKCTPGTLVKLDDGLMHVCQ
jgi:hypothetical protein